LTSIDEYPNKIFIPQPFFLSIALEVGNVET